MKKWVAGWIVLILVLIAGAAFCAYNYMGLKQYKRAISLINQMPEEEKNKAWDELSGTDKRGAQRGLLAGAWAGRVWVWTTAGLTSFVSDENSVYSDFEGCSDDIRARLNKGEGNVIKRTVFMDISKWKESAAPGDYVTVYITIPENGGILGNLREIYTYNFWLFMNKGIDTECAK